MLAYIHAKAKILEYIKNNGLQAGDRLPTELELSGKLQIGRLSLREGLNALKSEGIIVAVQGRGTFVACSSDHIDDALNVNYSVTEMIRCSGREPGVSYFKKEIVKADETVAKALKTEAGMDLMLCSRVRTADAVPVVLTKDYLAPRLATAFLELTEKELSLYEYIETNFDVKIGGSITEIAPVCADGELAEILNVPHNSPLLLLRATVNDICGTPLIYAVEYFRADKFKFGVTRGKQ